MIPTEEIQKDIKDTQREIDQYRREISALSKNAVGNRVAIYFREGRISQRKEFISKLEGILEGRK